MTYHDNQKFKLKNIKPKNIKPKNIKPNKNILK